MRLIDADALIDDIKPRLWDWDSVDGITATTVGMSDTERGMTMKLKNCPNCESGAITLEKILRRRGDIEWIPHRWFVKCWECEHRGPTRWTKARAVKAWNKWNGVILR